MLGFGLGFGFRIGLGRDDLDDHFRWLQPIDLGLGLLCISHLDHQRRVLAHERGDLDKDKKSFWF